MIKELAIDGGKPVVPEGLVKSWPIIIDEDIKSVVDVLKSGSLGFKQTVAKQLAGKWAEYVGTKYGLSTNSGTSALHCAFAGVGVEPGDEVIAPAYTFIGSISGALHHNAIPVFVDIDPKTYLIDPKKIEAKITERSKVIVPVHLHGMCCDMDEINKIARKYNLKVVEDACQAEGAEYKGKKSGNLGDAAGFSLETSKNLCGGEGGLMTTNDLEIRNKASLVRAFGEVIDEGKTRKYDAFDLGWMYRSAEMSSALALSQLKRLDEYNGIRQRNAEYLTKHLAKIEGLIPPYVPDDRTHVYYLYRIRFDPDKIGLKTSSEKFRDALIKVLQAEGVETGTWHTIPVPEQTIFRTKVGYGKGCPWSCPHSRKDIRYGGDEYPEAAKALKESFILAIYKGINPPNGIELMEHYVEAFKKVFDRIDRVIEICYADL